MEPVLFTLLIVFLMVAAVVWLVVHVIVLLIKGVVWGVKAPIRLGRHLMIDPSSRPILSRRCANRKCGCKLREEGRFCPRCGVEIAPARDAFIPARTSVRPVSRVA